MEGQDTIAIFVKGGFCPVCRAADEGLFIDVDEFVVEQLDPLRNKDRNVCFFQALDGFVACANGCVLIDDDRDPYAPLFCLDHLIDKAWVREGEKGNADRSFGGADFFAQRGERRAARIGKEPKLDLLSADFCLEIARRKRFVFLEEFGQRRADKTDDEIVVHLEGGGGHVRRADEDGGVVEDEDFLVHEGAIFDRMELRV